MLRMLAFEFGLLGLLAGAAGAALGGMFASLLLSRILHQSTVTFDPAVSFAGVLLTAVLGAAAGCASSLPLLRRKPLEVLRTP